MRWIDLSGFRARAAIAEDMLGDALLYVVAARYTAPLREMMQKAGFRRVAHGDYACVLGRLNSEVLLERLSALHEASGGKAEWVDVTLADIYPQLDERWQNGSATELHRETYEALYHALGEQRLDEPQSLEALHNALGEQRPDNAQPAQLGAGGPDGLQLSPGELERSGASGDREELSGQPGGSPRPAVSGVPAEAQGSEGPADPGDTDPRVRGGAGGSGPESAEGTYGLEPGAFLPASTGADDPNAFEFDASEFELEPETATPSPVGVNDPQPVDEPVTPQDSLEDPRPAELGPSEAPAPEPAQAQASDVGSPLEQGASPSDPQGDAVATIEDTGAELHEAPAANAPDEAPTVVLEVAEASETPEAEAVAPAVVEPAEDALPAFDEVHAETPDVVASPSVEAPEQADLGDEASLVASEPPPSQIVEATALPAAGEQDASATDATPPPEDAGTEQVDPAPQSSDADAGLTAADDGNTPESDETSADEELDSRTLAERAALQRHAIYASRAALLDAPPSAPLSASTRPVSRRERVAAAAKIAEIFTGLAAERAGADRNGLLFTPDLSEEQRQTLAAGVGSLNAGHLTPQQTTQYAPLAQHLLKEYRRWSPQGDDAPSTVERLASGVPVSADLSPEQTRELLYRAEALDTSNVTTEFSKGLWALAEKMGFAGGEVLLPNSGVGELSVHKPKGVRVTQVPNHPLNFELASALHPEDVVIDGPYAQTVLPARHYDLCIAVSNHSTQRSLALGGRTYVHDEAINAEPSTPPLTPTAHLLYKSAQKLKPGGIGMFAVRSEGIKDELTALGFVLQHLEVIASIPVSSQVIEGQLQPVESGTDSSDARAALGQDIESVVLLMRRRTEIAEEQPAQQQAIALRQRLLDVRPLPLLRLSAVRTFLDEQATAGQTPNYQAIYGVAHKAVLDELLGATPAGLMIPPDAPDNSVPVLAQLDPALVDEELGDIDGCYTLDEAGRLLFRSGGELQAVDLPPRQAQIVSAMVQLRDDVRRAMAVQLRTNDDTQLRVIQRRLRQNYDAFVERFGPLTKPETMNSFARDMFANMLLQVEIYDPDTDRAEPSKFFTERVVRRTPPVVKAQTPREAVSISMGRLGRVDPDLVASLLSRKWDDVRAELVGVVFRDPIDGRWVTASQYLSGPVRAKLASAYIAEQIAPDMYVGNIEALEEVQPPLVSADNIDFSLGAPWIPARDFADFVAAKLGVTPENWAAAVTVRYQATTATFTLTIDAQLTDPALTAEYESDHLTAKELFQSTLNGRSIRVMVPDPEFVPPPGVEKPKIPQIVDHVETARAHVYQERLKDEFNQWAHENEHRAQRLARIFNERVNAYADRVVDGSYITFERCSPLWHPMSHQRDGLARFIEDGNLLVAHGLGTGKTFTQAACAIESVRMGLSSKPMMVTPNATFSQTAAQIIQAYPTAKVLMAPKLSPRRPDDIREFVARAAMHNWDLIVITYESFKAIPLSCRAQIAVVDRQIDELRKERAIAGAEEDGFGRRATILGKRRRRIAELSVAGGIPAGEQAGFDAIGVDLLIVDEGQNFKNADISTKLNILGVTSTGSDRARDLEYKIDHIRSFNRSHRGIVMATATPICNSIAEVYTMMNYINPQILRGMNIRHFDAWAATFGRAQTIIEQKPAGDGFQMRERFIRFQNVPELVRAFKMIADLRLDDDQTDQSRPRPGLETVLRTLPRDRIDEAVLKSLEVRARGLEEQDKLWNRDGVIVIMGDLRRAMLDVRLIDPTMPRPEYSISSDVADVVYRDWEASRSIKGTQIVFSDQGVAGHGYSIHRDIKELLVERGIPEREIAIITDYNKLPERHRLFQKVNKGTVRVLIGSSTRIGVGVNVQERVVAMHHVDVPLRPDLLAQRIGRGQRPGNMNALTPGFNVKNYVYAKQGQTRAFEILQNKAAAIQQAFRNPDKAGRRLEEEMDVTLENIQVELTDNNLLREKVTLDNEIKTMTLAKAAHVRACARAKGEYTKLAEQLEQVTAFRDSYVAAAAIAKAADAARDAAIAEDAQMLHEARANVGRISDRMSEIGAEIRQLRDQGRLRLKAAQKEAAAKALENAPEGETVATLDESAPQEKLAGFADLTGEERREARRASLEQYQRDLAEAGVATRESVIGSKSTAMADTNSEQGSESDGRSHLTAEELARVDELSVELAALNRELTDARLTRDSLAAVGESGCRAMIATRFNAHDDRSQWRQAITPGKLGLGIARLLENLERGGKGVLVGEVHGVAFSLRKAPTAGTRFASLSEYFAASDRAAASAYTAETQALGLVHPDMTPDGYADLHFGDLRISVPLSYSETGNAMRILWMFDRFPKAVDEALAGVPELERICEDRRRRAEATWPDEARLHEALSQKVDLDRQLLEQGASMTPEFEREIMEPILPMRHGSTGRPFHPDLLREWAAAAPAEGLDEAPLEDEPDAPDAPELPAAGEIPPAANAPNAAPHNLQLG